MTQQQLMGPDEKAGLPGGDANLIIIHHYCLASFIYLLFIIYSLFSLL